MTSTSTISALGVERDPREPGGTKRPQGGPQLNGHAGDTELAKLIRYGCQFELQVHQMVELGQMRAENAQLRRKVEEGAEVPAPLEDLVARPPNPTRGKKRASRAESGGARPGTGRSVETARSSSDRDA